MEEEKWVGPQGRYGLVGGNPLKNSRSASPFNEDKTKAPQVKYGRCVGPQDSYGLEGGNS